MKNISKLGFAVLLTGCTAISGARAAEQPVCEFNKVSKALQPIMATHTFPPYPQMSVMTNEQGTTLMTVTIGADGIPTDVQVEKTSGAIRLDEAARDHVKKNWRWVPIKGCPVVQTRVSIKWDLRDAPQAIPPGFLFVRMKPEDFPVDALARHEQGPVAIMVALRPGGEFEAVKIAKSSGFPDLDAQSLSYARGHHWTPGQMDGKPVFTVFELVLLWGIDAPSGAAPH